MYLKACKILNVKIGAGQGEIKRAFRKLAVQYHPDVSDKPQTIQKFIEVNRAYKYLSDPGAYNRFINRHQVIREMKNRHHARESTVEDSMAYRKQKEEALPTMPPFVAGMAYLVEKFYDYFFLLIGLFMIFFPPIIFYIDDDIEIEDTGILPLLVPIVTGIAFLSGVFFYMLKHNHPFALRIQVLFYRLTGKK